MTINKVKTDDLMVKTHQMRIEVRLPNGHWAGDVTRKHPSSILRIDEHMALGKGKGSATITATEDISSTIMSHPGVNDFAIIESNRYSVTINAGGGGFLKPLLDVEVIPHTPFEVRDGWVDWVIECSRDKMRRLVDRLKADEIPHRLISTRCVSTRLLTNRQREIFDIAIREGFYDSKRKITLTALAGLLGISKSTLSAQMQRMESKIMDFFTEEIRRRSP
ncbi:MAG: helix-turn-helix domain-containing protein [Candidatus Poseidoniaceae archaeon]|jgi:predicted DNA binding protein|nr:helix-turn-helix domain-containing protein [Candidatus Poseidoniaceae archaeon]